MHLVNNKLKIKSKIKMERQIRANGAVIGTQKSSYKYIHHNLVREFHARARDV